MKSYTILFDQRTVYVYLHLNILSIFIIMDKTYWIHSTAVLSLSDSPVVGSIHCINIGFLATNFLPQWLAKTSWLNQLLVLRRRYSNSPASYRTLTLKILGGGQVKPCDVKFSEKCPCSHHTVC